MPEPIRPVPHFSVAEQQYLPQVSVVEPRAVVERRLTVTGEAIPGELLELFGILHPSPTEITGNWTLREPQEMVLSEVLVDDQPSRREP